MKILVVDDEPSNRRTLEMVLQKDEHQVLSAENGEEALKCILEYLPDVILTDLNMPIMGGMELLQTVKEAHPSVEVIVTTAFGSIDTAVEAMKLGAWDFITKPIKRNELRQKLFKIQEKQSLRAENQQLRAEIAKMRPSWIGQSAIMQQITEEATSVADSEASVFLVGASGTGKSMLAKWIHSASPRNTQTFITLNCGAIPENLMESEMFGHEKGAFTGAVHQKKGKFELADKGTLFLDEVTEMAPHLQVKLLRVLQDGEFERVGGSKTIHSDLRIIAASNRNLTEAIASGQFREDLYYRLNVVQIHMPDLQKRVGDIPLLVQYFLQFHAQRNHRPPKSISPEALDLLQTWHWPGNVRELENVIERAVVLSKSHQIEVQDLPLTLRNQSPTDNLLHFALGTPLKDIEKQVILSTLAMVDGDKVKAAEILGITARTIYRKESEWKSDLD